MGKLMEKLSVYISYRVCILIITIDQNSFYYITKYAHLF